MDKQKSIEILQRCIDELENMTQEEFERLEKEKGLDKKIYDTAKYIDEDIEIILP